MIIQLCIRLFVVLKYILYIMLISYNTCLICFIYFMYKNVAIQQMFSLYFHHEQCFLLNLPMEKNCMSRNQKQYYGGMKNKLLYTHVKKKVLIIHWKIISNSKISSGVKDGCVIPLISPELCWGPKFHAKWYTSFTFTSLWEHISL